MSEQTTQAESSPAETADVFNGEQPTLSEFNEYRQSGEIPARFKPAEEEAESAPADASEETTESEDDESETESESETEEAQEQAPKGNSAEKRIKQLLAKTKELERQLATKQDVKTEPSPAQQTRTKPTADDKDKDGNQKYNTYEDFVEDLADWKAEQRIDSAKREQAQQQAMSALKATLEEARSRYDDADEVIFPASQAIQDAKIPLAVKEVFAQSENFIDLCYVVGSDPAELKKFIALAQSNPRAAIGKVFEYERGIKEELSKSSEGKATPEPKKTSAPKPPATVGGSSSRAFDVSDESLSPEEWSRKRTEYLAKKR
jgi:hypothetical protein